MIKINISTEVSNISELSDMLRNIANQIDNGNTSGYYPTWNINDETERLQKIEYIKRVLSNWGMTTTAELELESSPVFNNVSGKVCALVEEFTQDYVRVITYDDEIIITEDDVPYEDLSDDLIDEIYEIIDQYDVAQQKLHDSCRNEDRD